MNAKNFSSKKFESLSEAEQLQFFNDLLKDIPLEDLKMLRDVLPELSRIQRLIDSAKQYDK